MISQGERGDQGEPGDRGEPGEIGQTGERGRRGQQGDVGDSGSTGERGEPGRNYTRPLLVMFIFVTLVFIILAYRVQENTARIEREGVAARYQGCINGTVVLTQFNDLMTNLVAVQQQNIRDAPHDKDLVQARRRLIVIYSDAVMKLPNCDAIRR